MGLSLSFVMFMQFLFLLSLLSLVSAGSFSSTQPLCHDDESFALLQFKESLIINQSTSAYSKISSWMAQSSDCCTWDGIQCDENTGHVISLDLSNSSLYGSINSNSSLFQLVHLQKLNLSINNFNHSEIPIGVRQLSKLTHLDLSCSGFSGKIPSEILQLSKLVSLNLALNPLKLHKPGLRSIAEKLTNLEELILSEVDISSTIPSILANLSSLTTIFLRDCDLHGEFPTGIFQLPNLKSLSVRSNPKLTGWVPEFNRSSRLEYLTLRGTSFSGKLPDSIGNLKSLYYLDAKSCNFSVLGRNELTGPIPSWLANLTQLITLWLPNNKLCGPIPTSISSLLNLQILELYSNNLSGTIEFDSFRKLNNLFHLDLSFNNLSLVIDPSTNSTFQTFNVLGMGSCNLSNFPEFLRNQDQLEVLVLSRNKIHGQIPKWISNLSKDTLVILEMSDNLLTGFDQISDALPWTNLQVLYLSNNKLKGSLPIPPPSIFYYSVSNNMLSGNISQMICKLSSLSYLDFSYNNLSGFLPQCLGDLRNLYILNLQNNNFHGRIPQIFMEGCKLRMMSLNQNRFQGALPRSLTSCTMLEILDIGNNYISDIFPSWLGILPELRVLILQSNGFHGSIGKPETNSRFPKLHVIDLSNNYITGKLPYEYFQIWKAMQILDVSGLAYMQTTQVLQRNGWVYSYRYPMILTNKGIKIKYSRIQDFFVAIDLSSNNFEGEIPKVVGNLNALYMLNLSNNFLTGFIPLSLATLTNLESLDLSQNMLVGEIPPQLVELTFLTFLNVSYNNLTGPIPQGKQFLTFQNNSFDGNVELCGNPLSKRCASSEDSPTPPSNFEANQGSEFSFEFGWKVVAMGYGCGFIVGVFVGQIIIKRKSSWFIKFFAIGHPTGRRVKWRRH
ncbi:receptor-like protein 6 [Castanea sativa]|uniref:receptor-like protein 6 n=1 Tax=Castanea sativa TaxID=21020 RepID=UPI003F64CF3C